MNSPQRQEMDKLRKIQSQIQSVAERIATRLPVQSSHLAAFVCATKWRLQTLSKLKRLTQETTDATVKKMRMEVGAFEYATKEQSELLTRALFQLDDILSHGDAKIKEARKALVLSIQSQLDHADALKTRATKLKDFTESVITLLPAVESEDKEEVAMEDVTVENTTVEEASPPAENDEGSLRALFESADEEDEEEEETEETEPSRQPQLGQPLRAADETMEETTLQEDEQADGDDDDDADFEEGGADEEADDDEMDDVNATCDIRSLPVWRPYYQIQQRPDGLYLVANLHGVDQRHIRIEASPQTGLVRISGFKLPTQKDLLLSRLRGAPTFGRFEIVERFPAQQLSLANATQLLDEDGTLQVRVPFYFVHHPRVLRRVSSAFQPHRLAVW